MSSYHIPVEGGVVLADSRANAFQVLTNGVVDNTTTADKVDTFNGDNTGWVNDFVGLLYDQTSRFDTITVELGTQFGDGGDWESLPTVYVLKNPTLLGDTTEPNLSPAWVPLSGAVETTGHTFNPLVTPGPGSTVNFDLTSIPVEDRVGWGWAVGGVDGNAAAGGAFNFINVTEVSAEGEAAPVPAKVYPSSLVPVNVVANAYHSPGFNGIANDNVTDYRGSVMKAITNGVVDHGAQAEGFDTFSGDAAGVVTDFVGLQYTTLNTFDSVTVDMANQFADGGDWDSTPRVFVLKNPVDTDTTAPEDDPDNWYELVGAPETTGHVYSPMVTPGPGGTMNFDLSGFTDEERTGWGIAVGGVDGNAAAGGAINFVSISELTVAGNVIPGPYELVLEVNETTGEVKIRNNTQLEIAIDYYQVSSDDGSLDLSPSGWDSLENPTLNTAEFPSGDGSGNGWEEFANLDGSLVAEGFAFGSSLMVSTDSVSLGALFDGGTKDLYFRYRTADGVFVDSNVEYVSSPGLQGDFNNDNVVDSIDYAIWRENLGTTFDLGGNGEESGASGGIVDQADFDLWLSQYGASISPADSASTPAPEPATLLLIALAAATGMPRRGIRH